MDSYGIFTDGLRALISGQDERTRAGALTQKYWSDGYTGSYFHRLVDDAHPDEITERDIVAVSTLSVTVPSAVAIWILGDGRSPITKLLGSVPRDVDIWNAGDVIASGGELDRLWALLK